jgi:hypothetical protein
MSTNTPIATQTLTAAAASVTFSSIPQGYTDLILITSTKTSSGSADGAIVCTVNADAGSNYSSTALYGTGSSALSFRSSNQTKMYFGRWSNTQYTATKTQFQNYSNGTTYKTVLSQGGNTTDYIFEWVNTWRSTSAITSMELKVDDGSNFAIGSTFSIYGIQAGNKDQKATGGNIVTTDGTYMYHAFTSSGYFIPNEALTADYLVVAGGGAGGNDERAGAGGAGGLRHSSGGSPLSLTAKSYPVVVGAGGTFGSFNSATNTNGGNSVFSTISASGGGRGAVGNGSPGGNGGSGGGSWYGGSAGLGNTGSYSPVEGYNGSVGETVANFGSGAGGGAGGAATNGTSGAGGNGGIGLTNSLINAMGAATLTGQLSSGNYYYAGGGSGDIYAGYGYSPGTPGLGGGGTGDNPTSAGSSTALASGKSNTGGGGGAGGNGGAGIVIIRYLL